MIPALLLALLAPHAGAPAGEIPPDRRREDLAFLVETLRATHPEPHAFADERRWAEAVDEAAAEIEGGSDAAHYLALARVVALLQDGHTALIPGPEVLDRVWPVRFTFFDDGLFVTGAEPALAHALGRRVLAFGDFAVEDVVAALEPAAFGDNPRSRRTALELFLSSPRLLHAVGVLPEPLRGRITLADGEAAAELALEGTSPGPPRFDGELPPGWVAAPFGAAGEPPWRAGWERSYWLRHDAQESLLYLKYNRVQDDPDEPLAAFARRAVELAATEEVERVVLDLRGNGGGNNYLNQPLVHALLCSPWNRPGRLFVITDRRTFSAAMNCASYLERETFALFAGEPTGGRPNHFGDAEDVRLPGSGWTLLCSTLRWQDSAPNDARPWIRPDLPAPATFADWRAGRDAALEAILAFDPASAAAFGRIAPVSHWSRPGQELPWRDFLDR